MDSEQRRNGVADSGAVVLQRGPVAAVQSFRTWLATVDVGELSDRERVDLVAELERVKGGRVGGAGAGDGCVAVFAGGGGAGGRGSFAGVAGCVGAPGVAVETGGPSE